MQSIYFPNPPGEDRGGERERPGNEIYASTYASLFQGNWTAKQRALTIAQVCIDWSNDEIGQSLPWGPVPEKAD